MKLTIEEYLQARVIENYTFSSEAIQAAMDLHNIASGVSSASVTQELKDLAEAELWEMASGFISGGGGSVRFGIQSKTDASISADAATRQLWSSKAQALRAKWGVATSSDSENIYDGTRLW